LTSVELFYEMGMDFLRNFDSASIQLHSMSHTWQFKPRHSTEMEGHVASLNTFFLLFRLKVSEFLWLCNFFFLFSPLFSSCPWCYENYVMGLEFFTPKRDGDDSFRKQNI